MLSQKSALPIPNAGFMLFSEYSQRYCEAPDATLDKMGGCRVDVAIGLGRMAYQLVIAQDQVSGAPTVSWTRAATIARKLKDTETLVALENKVPLTLVAAIISLCESFNLNPEEVRSEGCNLLAFWEATQVGDKFELPMSADWARHSLKLTLH